MIEYNINGIIADVRRVLDNNITDTSLSGFGDPDTLSLDEIIKGNIEPAARMIEENCPVDMLEGGLVLYSATDGREKGLEDGVLTLELPSDFMRLVSFRMADWRVQVNSAIGPDDARYAQQKSRLSCFRGNPERPVVTITPTKSKLYLEAYSTKRSTSTTETTNESGEATTITHYPVSESYYQPIPSIMESGNISLPKRLKDAIVYAAAYYTALTYVAAQQAQMLLSASLDLAHINNATTNAEQ